MWFRGTGLILYDLQILENPWFTDFSGDIERDSGMKWVIQAVFFIQERLDQSLQVRPRNKYTNCLT